MLLVEIAAADLLWTPNGLKGILLGGIIACVNVLGTLRDTNRIVKYKTTFVYYIGVIGRLILSVLIIVTFFRKFPGSFSIPGIFIGLSVVPITFFLLVFQAILLHNRTRTR